ncbi:hypothetical protein ACTWPT_29800 [Nonomuraea sp. 3N208]|uniref:hypothetical protein n=1 Tax=Nonomuraea sp. 3N208 TaxID=3457421 RepID=UPI003FD1FF80
MHRIGVNGDRLADESGQIGGGSAVMKEGGTLHFVFSDVFTFEGDAISRLETYQVNLG